MKYVYALVMCCAISLASEQALAGLIFGRLNLEKTSERIDFAQITCEENGYIQDIVINPDGSYKAFLKVRNTLAPCELVVGLSSGEIVRAYIKTYVDEEVRYEFDIVKIGSRHEMYRR